LIIKKHWIVWYYTLIEDSMVFWKASKTKYEDDWERVRID
jgi:hypothetical protein